MRIIDLTYPIEDHFRWTVERSLAASFAEGAQFQVTRFGLAVHGFTHIDAPRHMLPGGYTTSDFRLESLVGEAAIVDLTAVEPGAAIPADAVAEADIRPGDLVFLETAWDLRHPLSSPLFWTAAPYLTREACELLLDRRPSAVGFDFPQDKPIRNLLSGETAPIAEFVSHDVLLRNGIPLIEYLRNLSEVSSRRVEAYALPLALPEADGAPARVVAIER